MPSSCLKLEDGHRRRVTWKMDAALRCCWAGTARNGRATWKMDGDAGMLLVGTARIIYVLPLNNKIYID